MLVHMYHSAWCYIPEDNSLHIIHVFVYTQLKLQQVQPTHFNSVWTHNMGWESWHQNAYEKLKIGDGMCVQNGLVVQD
jgi:hypothetical protein